MTGEQRKPDTTDAVHYFLRFF